MWTMEVKRELRHDFGTMDTRKVGTRRSGHEARRVENEEGVSTEARVVSVNSHTTYRTSANCCQPARLLL